MKVFIQHPDTLRYLDNNSEWTSDISQARNFQFALHAISYGVNQLQQPFLMFFKLPRAHESFTSDAYAHGVPRPTHLLDNVGLRAA